MDGVQISHRPPPKKTPKSPNILHTSLYLPKPLAKPAAECEAAVTAALAAQLLYGEYPAALAAAE